MTEEPFFSGEFVIDNWQVSWNDATQKYPDLERRLKEIVDTDWVHYESKRKDDTSIHPDVYKIAVVWLYISLEQTAFDKIYEDFFEIIVTTLVNSLFHIADNYPAQLANISVCESTRGNITAWMTKFMHTTAIENEEHFFELLEQTGLDLKMPFNEIFYQKEFLEAAGVKNIVFH